MKIDMIADQHGCLPDLKGGDVLILAGDYTATDSRVDWATFFLWLFDLDYKHILFIGGNHDNYLVPKPPYFEEGVHYLKDSGCEIEGVKFWGSPWTLSFEGMNPACMAFTKETDEELDAKWALIPDDTEVLITHSPPQGILDIEHRKYTRIGSYSLERRIGELKKLRLSCFGHIHEGRGQETREGITFVNASYVGRDYKLHKKDEVISVNI